MSEIEKMKRYIDKTNLPDDPEDKFCFCLGEMKEIGEFAQSDMFHALGLLFKYGKAKGYRAAKAEGRAQA